jgi:hypothetical protein
MKNLLFGLIATFVVNFSFFAQETKIEIGKITSGSIKMDLPIEIISTSLYKENSSEFTKTTRYSETLKGDVVVITDLKNKFVSITLPLNTPAEKVSPIANCIKDCWSNWNCFWDCLLN